MNDGVVFCKALEGDCVVKCKFINATLLVRYGGCVEFLLISVKVLAWRLFCYA